MKSGHFPCFRGGQRGFSLLELLIVLGLMATAAVLALSSVGNRDNQRRFEETRAKLTTIRKVIVGEPQILNGQLNVNGFVADMGRLPLDLNELLAQPQDCDPDSAGEQGCDWQFDTDTELWHGWHGPYINTIAGDYRDGWGNPPDDAANSADKVTTSTLDDAAENHGWYWEPLTANGLLLVSNGLDRAFSFDSFGEDTDNRLSGSSDQAYADSSLQRLQLAQQHTHSALPANPLHLTVQPAPDCGQCRDSIFDGDKTGCDLTPQRQWDGTRNYCVVDDGLTDDAEKCDALGNSRWMAVYGGSSCDSPKYTFVSNEFCARPIHIEHGLIGSNSHKTRDTAKGNITGHFSGNPTDPAFDYQPAMETNAATPVAGLTLPQGQMRFGLFKFDESQTPQCTTEPYPSKSAQALSDIITLSSQYPPNIGTSTHPINLKWRSQ